MSMGYYLQKLIEKCNKFDIDEIPAAAGLEFDEELTLDQIYVDYTTLSGMTDLPKTLLMDRLPLRENEVPVVMLTAPAGGGKTVLLKHWVTALAEDILRNREAGGAYLPVWISPEEIEEIENIEDLENRNLQEILQAAMAKIAPGMTLPEEGSWTYVLLVDGMEKFRNAELRDRFFYLLMEFYKEHRDTIFIMAARTEDYEHLCDDIYLDPLKAWRERIVFAEIKIPGLFGQWAFEEIIRLFACKWLRILNPHAANSLKMIKDAGKIAEDLHWVGLKDFLNTPFEITNWILLYLRDNCLPEGESTITAREIGLLLERKRSDKYHILDVKRHLARIAYAASMRSVIYPHPKLDFEEIYKSETMEHGELRDIIYRTDCDLGRYFEYRQDTTVETIDEFIKYLVSTGILCRPGGGWPEAGYTFSNYRYQVYLTVFCLTQNLFTREESRDPAMHIKYYSWLKKWTGSNELWRRIILSLAEQNTELRDHVIQAALDVAREKYWDVFPFDCLLELLAKYGIAVTEEAYRESCRMLCIHPEITNELHKQDVEDRRKLLSEKIYEICSIIHHNSRERNEYLQKCITEGYDRCASEEERQQFSEYAGAVTEYLKNTLELQESEDVMRIHQEKWEKTEKALQSDGTEFTVCGYLYKILKEECTKEERQLFLQQLIELDLIQTREKEYAAFNEKDLDDLACWSIGYKVEQKMQQLKKTNSPENFYAALEEFLFENSEFDTERAQSIALYLCLTAEEPAPEDLEEMKRLAEEFGL